MTRPNFVQYTQIRPQTPKISAGNMFLSPFDPRSPRVPAQAWSGKLLDRQNGHFEYLGVFGVKNRSKMTRPNLVQYTQIRPQTPKISAGSMFLSPFDPRTPRVPAQAWSSKNSAGKMGTWAFSGSKKSVKNDLTQFGPIHPNPASDTQNKYCKHVFEPV